MTKLAGDAFLALLCLDHTVPHVTFPSFCRCAVAHQAAASEGATAPPALDEVVDLHFVALLHRDGRLLQLDGRRAGPLDHGATSPEALLTDAVAVVRKFIEASSSLSFNLIALAPTQPE